MRRLYITRSVVLSVAVFASCGRKGESVDSVLAETEIAVDSSTIYPSLDSLDFKAGKVRVLVATDIAARPF